MRKAQEGKIITCILPVGGGKKLIQNLYEKGITRYAFSSARGYDVRDPLKKGLMPAIEKDVVTVICEDHHEGEEIFDFIYRVAEIGRPRGGLIYMSQIGAHVPFDLGEATA